MLLKIRDRIAIAGILDPQGAMNTIAIQRGIRKKVEIGADEMKAVSWVQNGDMAAWDQSKDAGLDVEFNEIEMQHLKVCARRAEDQKTVSEDNLDLVSMLLTHPSDKEKLDEM